jgi:hypothetical protein
MKVKVLCAVDREDGSPVRVAELSLEDIEKFVNAPMYVMGSKGLLGEVTNENCD